jgi:hypothetical protein
MMLVNPSLNSLNPEAPPKAFLMEFYNEVSTNT